MTEKLTGTSLDLAEENRNKLKQLFPSVFTETKNEKGQLVDSLDYEKLKAELGNFTDLFESRRERYGMEWPGKKEALKLVQQTSNATLKPALDESINFDTTENVFIEGDNLEVLKLLQKSYYGKIKMIYIDPPYNTGSDFVYPDNFSDNLQNYLEYTGQVDSNGKRFSTNTANEGRFHTKWINMMYPRLYLARNLLRDDGVIFISIDDNEVTNLKKICEEIFGETNFIGVFPWRSRTAKADVPFGISVDVEWILAFAKTPKFIAGRIGERKYYKSDDYEDKWRLQDCTTNKTKEERPNSYFPMINPRNGEVFQASELRTWAVTNDTFDGYYSKGKIVFPGDYEFLSIKRPAFRVFESEDTEKQMSKFGSADVRMSVSTYLPEKEIGRTEHGTKEIRGLFDQQLFPYPKPSSLIQFFVENICDPEALILDFFAGSATTAHAVLDLNKQDKGNRKFIMVQIPEPCTPGTEAFEAGYKTIAEISKERIRRVIKKLNTDDEGKLDFTESKQDRGFKVFKLDKTNFKQWEKLDPKATEEQIVEQLTLNIDNVSTSAQSLDLLYELILKAGFQLSEPVETVTLADKTVYSIAGGALLLCLEDTVTKELIDAVAECNPMQFICLDRAFHNNDQLKANAVQTFKDHNRAQEKFNPVTGTTETEKFNQIVFKTV